MFQKTPEALLDYFKPCINSDSCLEKCLGYYAHIFSLHPELRNVEHFVELEKNKKALELILN